MKILNRVFIPHLNRRNTFELIVDTSPETFSANIRLEKDVFRLLLQKTSSRRLWDVLIKTNVFALRLRLQKTSLRRLDQDQYIRLGHASSRRFQDVLQKRLQDVLLRYLQDVFKTSSRCRAEMSSRRFEDVFNSSQDIFERSCEDAFKRFSRRIIKFLVNTFSRFLRNVFEAILRRAPMTVTYSRICLGHTSEKFMVSVQNLQEL